ATLGVETPDWRRDLVVAGRVLSARDLYAGAAEALAGAVGAGASVGVAGESCLPLSAWRRIEAAFPSARFEPADDVLYALRARKSDAEIELCRRASAAGCAIQNAMLSAAAEGRTDND